MRKVWYIYKNGNNIGKVNKMNEVFNFVNELEGKELSGYEVRIDEIKWGAVYTAKKEDMK